MEKSEKFEKRRKSVETIFDIIFIFQVLGLIISIVFKVLFITGIASVDVSPVLGIVIDAVFAAFTFLCARLAHHGHIAAGIIGIIVALSEIILAGILWKIVGILLLIDSILYLVNYSKKA